MKPEINYKRAFIIIFLFMLGIVVTSFLFMNHQKPTVTNTGEGADKYSALNLQRAYTPNEWIMDGDTVYVNDSNVYIRSTAVSFTPTIELITKQYTGQINVAVLLDTNDLTPVKAETNPHYVDVQKSYVCTDYFNYTLTPTKHFWCWNNISNPTNTSYTQRLIFDHDFESGNVTLKTAYWTEQKLEWNDVSGAFQSRNINFYGMNKLFYKEGFNVVAGTKYTLKLTFSPRAVNIPSHKYWIVFYPTGETLEEAILNDHLYALDPWTADLTTGLESYYNFNEGVNTVLIDSKGPNNGSKLGSPTNVSGILGSAWSFDGSDDAFNVTNRSAFQFSTGNFSINFWVNSTTSVATAGQPLIGKIQQSGAYNGFLVNIKYTTAEGQVYMDNAGTQIGSGTHKLNVGRWIMVTLVRFNSNVYLYINGTLDKNITSITSDQSTTENLFFGYNSFNGYGNARLDEAGFWNGRALSEADITALYNGGAGITYAATDNSPTVTIDTPTTGLTINGFTINFNGSAIDDINLKNITLYGNFSGSWAANQSNTTVYNGSNTRFSLTLLNGAYLWNYQACDNSSQCVMAAANFSFNISVAGDTPPSITLNSPIDDYNTTAPDVVFNCTATDNFNVTNITFILNSNVNQTNETVINNSETKFSLYLSEAAYTWNCGACDNLTCVNGTARDLIVDRTSPRINITVPAVNYSNYSTTSFPYQLITNVTIVDALSSLHTCWVDNGTINLTVTCGNNATLNFSELGNWITWWANDTLGNTGYNSTYIYVMFRNITLDYPTAVIETTNYTYLFNITSTALSSSSVNMTYNWTKYVMNVFTSNATFASYNLSLISPTVAADVAINLSFQYSINGVDYTTSNLTQAISNFQAVTVTGAACNDTVYNITFYDEGNRSALEDKMDYVIKYGEADNTSKYVVSGNIAKDSEVYICMNKSLPATWYVGDAEFLYTLHENGTYVNRRYYWTNGTVLNTTNVTALYLYSLFAADATQFEMSYKDSSFLPVSGAIIEIKRKYIDDNSYKIVEMGKTDAYGKTTVYLNTEDAIYKFIVKKDGITLREFGDSKAYCPTPTLTECVISLNNYVSSIPVTDFEKEIDFSGTPVFNRTIRSINLSFTIPSGTTRVVSLNVTKIDAVGTTGCSAITSGASGSIGCILPSSIGNSTVYAIVYSDNVSKSYTTPSFSMSNKEIYGGVLVILSVFLLLTLLGAGLSDSPTFTIVFFLIGVIFLFAINIISSKGLIGGTATILWLVIAIVLILIKANKRSLV